MSWLYKRKFDKIVLELCVDKIILIQQQKNSFFSGCQYSLVVQNNGGYAGDGEIWILDQHRAKRTKKDVIISSENRFLVKIQFSQATPTAM